MDLASIPDDLKLNDRQDRNEAMKRIQDAARQDGTWCDDSIADRRAEEAERELADDDAPKPPTRQLGQFQGKFPCPPDEVFAPMTDDEVEELFRLGEDDRQSQ